uniref:CCHC-type domain-containing protein n=1 Tax=Knipowitschia caucasica TaxID=637954 RepID=A0AAV2KE24_KNICA
MDPEELRTPAMVGRGRGGLVSPLPFPLSGVGSSVARGRATPRKMNNVCFGLPKCSTGHVVDDETVGGMNQMSDMMQQMGHMLADNIVSRLNSSSSSGEPPRAPDSSPQANGSMNSRSLNLSNVTFIEKGAKEPPVFRGDGSDVLAVDEWEDLMKVYLRKSNVPIECSMEEVLVYLKGKARNVVKLGLKNGGLDSTQGPEAIYGLLRKHFGAGLYSSVPLADFYSIRPTANEGPYDFWLRLNNAADTAASCLAGLGKSSDIPGGDVTRLFIRHCPNKELSYTFRSKTIDKWSARDVQEVLDEYHLEHSSKGIGVMNTVTVNKSDVAAEVPPAANVTDHSMFEKLAAMLEKVLSQTQDGAQVARRPRRDTRYPKMDGLNSMPCAVCKDVSHTAYTHCMKHKLCFRCHAQGHSSRECPRAVNTSPSGPQGN